MNQQEHHLSLSSFSIVTGEPWRFSVTLSYSIVDRHWIFNWKIRVWYYWSWLDYIDLTHANIQISDDNSEDESKTSVIIFPDVLYCSQWGSTRNKKMSSQIRTFIVFPCKFSKKNACGLRYGIIQQQGCNGWTVFFLVKDQFGFL
jgi:hypothetical protein